MEKLEILKQTRSELSPNTDYGWGTEVVTEAMERYAKLYHESKVKKLSLSAVSGILPLSEYTKEKLKYINGSCIARDFPNNKPTEEWVGAVLDLLEELGLGNYR